jgi:hypothetical protein
MEISVDLHTDLLCCATFTALKLKGICPSLHDCNIQTEEIDSLIRNNDLKLVKNTRGWSLKIPKFLNRSLFIGAVDELIYSKIQSFPDIPTVDLRAPFFVDNVSVLPVPDHILNFRFENFHLVDSGGTGDCLIKAFNCAYNRAFDLPVLSSKSWYASFKLPMNQYLEEQHISSIALHYNVCICVIVHINGEIHPQIFGSDIRLPWLYLFNDYPHHYYSMCFEQDSDEDSNTGSEMSSSNSSEEAVQEINLFDPVLPIRPKFSLLISFMVHSEKFKFSSVPSALNCFTVLQSEVVLLLQSLYENNCVPKPDFFKLYYKFRHNVFSYLCLNSLTETLAFSTDVPLSIYIDSKKTPDYIIETDDSISILEFTVSNRYDTADFNKGGGNRAVKYSDEAREVELVTNKKTRVHIISAILNEVNVEEIMHLLNDLGGKTNENYLSDFFNISNLNRSFINQSQLTSSYTVDLPPINTDLDSFTRPNTPNTLMLPPEMLNSLLKAIDRFKNSTNLILTKGRRQFLKICHDLATDGTYIQYGLKIRPKLTAGGFLEGLRDNGLQYLLSVLNLFKEGKKFPWSDVKGSVPVTVSSSFKLDLKRMDPPYRFSDNVFSNSKFEDPEYDHLAIEGYVNLTDTNRVYFPPNYFHQLCNHSFDNIRFSTSKKMLANCTFLESDVTECMQIFNETQTEKNQILNFKFHPKPTYLFPIPHTFHDVPKGNPSILQTALDHVSGYTHEILLKAHQGSFIPTRDTTASSEKISEIRERLNVANREVFDKLKEHNLFYRGSKLTPKQKILVQEQKKQVLSIQSEYRSFLGTLKGTRNEHLVKLTRGKRSKWSIAFKKEMQHYNCDKSVYRGVGVMGENMYKDVDAYLKKTLSSFLSPVEMPLVPLFNSVRTPGPQLLNELKNLYTERAQKFASENFYQKRIDGITTFYSKIAVHLFNESTKSYNSSFVKVDTLGFDNFVILIRGGSKIYKHQVSKLFRIICFCSNEDTLFGGLRDNPNFTTIPFTNKTLVITPWSQVHQDILFDYMSLRERTFMNLFSTHTRVCVDLEQSVRPLTLMPFLLALHNRRKTETFMHNSRYLIVNPLALHANLQGLISSFSGFNYTYLDAWLRKRIELGYGPFSTTMMKAKTLRGAKIDSILSQGIVRDLWLDNPIENADQLTNFIYITYMMTKAPVNSSIEQANNIWEILQDVKLYETDHSDVFKLNDKSQRFSILEHGDEVYDDDFKYDPVFCNYLGHHLVGYLKNVTTPVEIANQWEVIKNQDLSSIANSNGLRGWNQSNFYNKKGYEVVFSKIDELLGDKKLGTLVDDYLKMDYQTAYSTINNDKIVMKEKTDDLIFHIVHKIQRGGGREIFCMDLDTKSQQNPIERLMKFICKKIPNEYISIPSNKRHGLIHSDFYEKKINRDTNFVYRWVLDCRRWAPHSVFQKYCYFIEGMSSILPPDFVIYFRDFSDKMFSKKFITRQHVYDKIKNNVRFKNYENVLKVSQLVSETYEMTVKFSFVMGIFNYLSTLMHSANQIVATEVVRDQCLKNSEGLVILDAKCHSDDSVVSSYHEKDISLRRSVILYDWLLKGANHMLSIKKSQINADVYLEFLSVLYLYDRFLPVLPKFSSTIPFRPSDKGYSSDISFAITQAIEMLSQGGSYEESFLIMKLSERFIQKCYRINVVAELPYQMLGGIDSHPIELLYSGGLSDAYRCLKYNPNAFWSAYSLLEKFELLEKDKSDITLKWDMSSRITGGPNKIREKYSVLVDALPEGITWTISNHKLGNGYLNLLWYASKLKDRMFYSALVDEPVSRRYSRMFGSGSSRTLLSSNGSRHSVTRIGISLAHYIGLQNNVSHDIGFEKFLDFCCRDLDFFYRAIDGATMKDIEPANHKEKPVVFYQGVAGMGSLSISSADYVSYTREPLGFKLLGKRANPSRECDKITTQLNLLGIEIDTLSKDQLYAVTNKLTKDESRNFRIVMPMPGDERKIDGYTDSVKTLMYNSIKWKRIPIRAKNTTIIDWNRRVVNGKLPDAVTEYLQKYWFDSLCHRYEVTDFDIFQSECKTLEQLRLEIPDEWKPIINSELNPSKYLIDMPYWCCWTKEQVKLGHNWYGSGECYISIPEVMIKLNIISGAIKSIEFEGDHSGPLSTASSWYLNVFFYYSGLQADLVPREFGDPSKIYLGQDTDGRFKIGRPNTCSMVYFDSSLEKNVIPSFSVKPINYTKKGATVIYHDTTVDYKVNFFIPLDQPVVLDISKFLNKEKLRKQLPREPKLNNFVQDYATSILGYTRKDPQSLKRNIDSSLIYNIIYNYSDKNSVYDNLSGSMPLMNSIMEWKLDHPGFGFPSAEDLNILAKKGDIAPLSPKMLDFVKTLGMSELNKIEFDSVISKVLTLAPEDREHYLINMYPHLMSGQQAGSLVVLTKSDRIFSSCTFVRKQHYELLISFIMLTKEAMEQGGIRSSILDQWSTRFLETHADRIFGHDVLPIILTQYLVDACVVDDVYASSFENGGLLYDILSELLDNGLTTWLNIVSFSDNLFRSVEFKVEKETIMNWFNDLLDNISMSQGPKPTRILTYQSLVGEKRGKIREGYFHGKWTPILKILARINLYQPPSELLITKLNKSLKKDKFGFRKAKRKDFIKLDLETDTQPGIAVRPFVPLAEEWQDEFNESWEYEDQLDDYEQDEEMEIPRLSYVYVSFLSLKNITRVRGTSWNLIIAFYQMDKSVLNCSDNITFYEPEGAVSNNFYNSARSTMKLAYLSGKKKSPNIQGYKKISWEKTQRLMSDFVEVSHDVDLEGKLVNKKDATTDPYLASKITTLDSYFKRMNETSLKKEIIKNQEILDFANVNMFMSEDYEREKSILDKMIEDAGAVSDPTPLENRGNQGKLDRPKIEVKSRDNDTDWLSSLKNILETQSNMLNNISDFITSGGEGSSVLMVDKSQTNYSFKEPVDLITDLGFKSEFETFFPGVWKSFINKEISMTKQQKIDRLTLARVKIAGMSSEEKRNSTMLYQLVMFVLNEIPDRGGLNHISNSFIVSLDSLFDQEMLNIEVTGLVDFNQLYAKPQMLIPEDVDIL